MQLWGLELVIIGGRLCRELWDGPRAGPDGAVEFTGVDEVWSVVSQTLCEFVAQSFCRGACVEVPLPLLPQAHSIDDLGEHLEKRLAVWLVLSPHSSVLPC